MGRTNCYEEKTVKRYRVGKEKLLRKNNIWKGTTFGKSECCDNSPDPYYSQQNYTSKVELFLQQGIGVKVS